MIIWRNRLTFAIHGSSLAPGNILLPGCWETYRTLRKSNILHKSQIIYKPSPISLSQVLKSLLLLHFDKYNIASLIIFEFTLIGAYSLVYIITVYYWCLFVDIIYILNCLCIGLLYMGIFVAYAHCNLYKDSLWQTLTNYKSSKQISFPLRSFI